MIVASARKRAKSTRERADFLIMSLPEPGARRHAHRILDFTHPASTSQKAGLL